MGGLEASAGGVAGRGCEAAFGRIALAWGAGGPLAPNIAATQRPTDGTSAPLSFPIVERRGRDNSDPRRTLAAPCPFGALNSAKNRRRDLSGLDDRAWRRRRARERRIVKSPSAMPSTRSTSFLLPGDGRVPRTETLDGCREIRRTRREEHFEMPPCPSQLRPTLRDIEASLSVGAAVAACGSFAPELRVDFASAPHRR